MAKLIHTHNQAEALFRQLRAALKANGLDEVEAVAWVERQDNFEFAKVRKGWGDEQLLELLTQPGTVIEVTRETATYTFLKLVGYELAY